MNVHVYCDGKKRYKDGNIPISIAVKNENGRFFINTGLVTSEKFAGREFPKSEKNRAAKNGALSRYLVKIEEKSLNYIGPDNKNWRLKLIQKFLIRLAVELKTLADYIHLYMKSAATDRTKEFYAHTERHVREFDKSAYLDNIDRDWLERYKSYFSKSLKINTDSYV